MRRLAAILELGAALAEGVLMVLAGVGLAALEHALSTPIPVAVGPRYPVAQDLGREAGVDHWSEVN